MKCFGLIGNPLGHSFSPLIHKHLFGIKNIDASYKLLETTPENLKKRIDELKSAEYDGFNVTIPYKIEIMKYLDEISPEALAIGSVNTICMKNGKVVGYNTDYFGFKRELEYYNIKVEKQNAYVLGTGGASKAITKALENMNANVTLVSRHPKNNIIGYEDLKSKKIDLIVNTTPVGMYPHMDDSPLDEEIASKAKCIVDIIFNPSKTKLMSYNKNSYNGLLMLIFQAAEAEDIWLDKVYDIDYNKIIEDVRGDIGE